MCILFLFSIFDSTFVHPVGYFILFVIINPVFVISFQTSLEKIRVGISLQNRILVCMTVAVCLTIVCFAVVHILTAVCSDKSSLCVSAYTNSNHARRVGEYEQVYRGLVGGGGKECARGSLRLPQGPRWWSHVRSRNMDHIFSVEVLKREDPSKSCKYCAVPTTGFLL